MKKIIIILLISLYNVLGNDLVPHRPSSLSSLHREKDLPPLPKSSTPDIFLEDPQGHRTKLDANEIEAFNSLSRRKRSSTDAETIMKHIEDPFSLQIPKVSYKPGRDSALKEKLDKWESLSHEDRVSMIKQEPSLVSLLISSNKAQISDFNEYSYIKGYLASRNAYVEYYGGQADPFHRFSLAVYFDGLYGHQLTTAQATLGKGIYDKAKQGIPLTKDEIELVYQMNQLSQSLGWSYLKNDEKQISLLAGGKRYDILTLYKHGNSLLYKYSPSSYSFSDVVAFIKNGIYFNDRNAFKVWLKMRSPQEKAGLANLLKDLQNRNNVDKEFILAYESVLGEDK